MTGWTVAQINAADGTKFPFWRVLDDAGETVWVADDETAAVAFAARLTHLHLECEFLDVVSTTWPNNRFVVAGGEQS